MDEHVPAAKSLRAWRAERLLSTRRLAQLAGTSNKTIVQLENGRQTAAFVTIEKICSVLRVQPREVNEFARALDVRAGIGEQTTSGSASASASAAVAVDHTLTHVYCIGDRERPALLAIAHQLLSEQRCAITAVVGASVSVEQVAAARPDLLVLDLEPAAVLDLLARLGQMSAIRTIPVIVTAEDGRLATMTGALAAAPDDARVVRLLSTPGEIGPLARSLLRRHDPADHPAG